MSVAITLTKIFINSSVLFIFVTKLAESYNEKPIEKEQKEKILSLIILLPFVTGFCVDKFGITVYILNILGLFLINKFILKQTWNYTLINVIFSCFITSLSKMLAILIEKVVENIPTSNFLSLIEFFVKSDLITVIFNSLLTFIILKYAINNISNLKLFIDKLNYKDLILFSCLSLTIILPVSYGLYFNTINIKIFIAIILIDLIIVLTKYAQYYIDSQDKLKQEKTYNTTLSNLVDSLRIVKHDYNNILQTINGYIVTKEYKGLEEHFKQLYKESNCIATTESVNPSVINQPAVYAIVGSKYNTAMTKNIKFDVDVETNIKEINFNFTDLSRILGILLDNAIEATEQADTKEMSISFSYNKRKQADMIEIKNHIKSNTKIDLNKIFDKGVSSKKIKSGLGLWEVKNIISKKHNSQIYANIENNTFSQTIVIEKS